MGQVLHGSAKTTHAIRAEIFRSDASIAKLAKRYGINPKTVVKWKSRDSVEDRKTGPEPKSTVLSREEEVIIIAFRRHTLLPLDDCLYALQETIPKLSRSVLHRCLQRHGISRLPNLDADKRKKQTFKTYPIGYLHVDIAEVRTEDGKLYLFVAIDRTSKFTYVELHPRMTKMIAAQFLRNTIKLLPYHIHTILTDNGIQFTNRKQDKHAGEHIFAQEAGFAHRVCREHEIEHRLTKINHPWTNGQVERMNRTIKEATVKRYYYENKNQLEKHLEGFMMAYNYAKRLKTPNPLRIYLQNMEK